MLVKLVVTVMASSKKLDWGCNAKPPRKYSTSSLEGISIKKREKDHLLKDANIMLKQGRWHVTLM